MPDDLTVTHVAAVPIATSSSAGPGNAAAPLPTTTPIPSPSPTLQLDQGLGIVVIEFHNADGKVESTIPTQRQLDAYRLAAEGNRQASPAGAVPSTPATSPTTRATGTGTAQDLAL